MRILLLSLALLFTASIAGQTTLSKLAFHSEAERSAFEDSESGKPNYLNLFVHSRGKVDEAKAERIHRQMNKITEDIESSGVLKKSTKKQAKAVYETVHERYFQLYELENAFIDIFTNGRYNCVSATAVYAMIFEELGIPYQIIEEPSHVYIIGWPKTDNIVIEGTDPQNGYYKVSSRFKERYVQSLIDGKILNPSAFLGMDAIEIYDKILGSERKEISLSQLVGIQYGNYGAFAIDQGDYETALENLQKASWFYPKSVYAVLENAARSIYLEAPETVVDDRFVSEMIVWSNDTLNKLQVMSISSCFARIAEQELYNTTDWSNYERWNNHLLANITDSTLLKELGFVYHYEFGRIAFQNAKYDRAIVQLDSAFNYQPDNSDLKTLFAASLAGSFASMSSHLEMLALVEKHEERHEEFAEEVNMQSLKSELFLRIAYEAFLDKDYARGMKWVEKFEANYDKGSAALLEGSLVGAVYSEAMGIQFVRGNRQTAKALVERGLKYDPSNIELMNRKRMMR